MPTCFLSLVAGGRGGTEEEGERGDCRMGEGSSRVGARRGAKNGLPLLPRPVNHNEQGCGVLEGTAGTWLGAQREDGLATGQGTNYQLCTS